MSPVVLSAGGVTVSALSSVAGTDGSDTGVVGLSLFTAAWATGEAVSGSVLVPELEFDAAEFDAPALDAGLPGLVGFFPWELAAAFADELPAALPDEVPDEVPDELPAELAAPLPLVLAVELPLALLEALPEAAGDGFPPPLLPDESGAAAAVAPPLSKSATAADATIATRTYGLFITHSQVSRANPGKDTRRVSKQSLMWDETPAQATMGRGLHCG